MKKYIILFIALVSFINGFAQTTTATIEGISYELNTVAGKAKVVGPKNINIEDLIIPAGFDYESHAYVVNEIAEEAFAGNNNIKTLKIEGIMDVIENKAFQNCKSLTKVTLHNIKAGTKDDAFFENCTNLEEIVLYDDFTQAFRYMFKECTKLNSFKHTADGVDIYDGFPTSLQTISFEAFSGCEGLESIHFPAATTSIDNTAFNHWQKITSITVDAENTRYTATDNCLLNKVDMTIPNNTKNGTYYSTNPVPAGQLLILGCKESQVPAAVTVIEGFAFDFRGTLPNIFDTPKLGVSNYITNIGAHAFEGTTVTNVDFVSHGNKVTYIGDFAFAACHALTSVVLPTNAEYTTIRNDVFQNCTTLNNVTIPTNVTEIWKEAFQNCGGEGFTTVTLHDGITLVDDRAFADCGNLTNLTLSNGMTVIHDACFYACAKLPSVTIPASITTIEDNAFQGDRTLTSVTFNSDNTLLTIGSQAFMECAFSTFDIPGSVTAIGAAAYSGCTNLTGIVIPDGVTIIEPKTFQQCEKMVSVKMGDGVREIRDAAFINCYALTTVQSENPDNVVSGSGDAATGVILPSKLVLIGNEAFQNNQSLKKLYIPKTYSKVSESAEIGAGIFGYNSFGQDPNLVLYFYCGEAANTPGDKLIASHEMTDNEGTHNGNSGYNNGTNPIRKYAYWHPAFVKDNGTVYCHNCHTVFDDNDYRNCMYNLIDESKTLVEPSTIEGHGRYMRTFTTKNQWQPLIVPFNSTKSDWGEGVDIAYLYNYYEMDDEEGYISIIQLKSTDPVKANLPYLIRKKDVTNDMGGVVTVDNITLLAKAGDTNTTVSNDATEVSCASTIKVYTMKGSYEPQTVTQKHGEIYNYFMNGGALVYNKNASDYGMKPLRWYMTVTSKDYDGGTGSYQDAPVAAKSYTFVEEDSEVSAIEHAEMAEKERRASLYYNINGMRMQEMQKGLNIVRMSDGTVRKVFKK